MIWIILQTESIGLRTKFWPTTTVTSSSTTVNSYSNLCWEQCLRSMMRRGTYTARLLRFNGCRPCSWSTVDHHRSSDASQLAMCGTLVVAGSSRDHITVLIPDTVGTMVNADSPLALQHVVGLQLGTPVDLSSSLPPPDLDRALSSNSVLPSLIRKRKAYWSEYKWYQVSGMRLVYSH